MAEDSTKSLSMEDPGTPGSKQSSKGTAIGGLLLVFGLGFGVWWAFIRTRPVSPADQVQSGPVKAVLPLESFTVNLADPEEGRFLRTTLSLGVDGELPAVTKGENKGVETGGVTIATIRDSILTVLAQCKSEDLLLPEGKLKLKADLIKALNRDVPALGVQEIYFTEFLVQR